MKGIRTYACARPAPPTAGSTCAPHTRTRWPHIHETNQNVLEEVVNQQVKPSASTDDKWDQRWDGMGYMGATTRARAGFLRISYLDSGRQHALTRGVKATADSGIGAQLDAPTRGLHPPFGAACPRGHSAARTCPHDLRRFASQYPPVAHEIAVQTKTEGDYSAANTPIAVPRTRRLKIWERRGFRQLTVQVQREDEPAETSMRWTRVQLEGLSRDKLRSRALDLREALGWTRETHPRASQVPSTAPQLIEWILQVCQAFLIFARSICPHTLLAAGSIDQYVLVALLAAGSIAPRACRSSAQLGSRACMS